MAKRSRVKIRLDFRTSENFELLLWPTGKPQRSANAYCRVLCTLPFPGSRNLFGLMHQPPIMPLRARIGKFWVPESRFSTTSFRTRFAALRSVTQSRDGPPSRVLSYVLGVWIHGERLQNDPLAQKWRNEIGRKFVWIFVHGKTLNVTSGRLVSHSDLAMHSAGYIVPYHFRR